MILDVTGAPVPPQDIVDRLQRIDDHLDLKYVQMGDPEMGLKHWAVVERWNANDSRRARIQAGEMSPESAFDVIGYLPLDTNPESAFGYIEMTLTRIRGHPRIHVDHLLNNLHKWNENAHKENRKATTELADELIETNARTLFRDLGKAIPKIFVTDRRPKPKAK